MMSEPTKPKSRVDRLVKWGFLIVAVVAAVLVGLLQRNPPLLDWSTDLPGALARGKAEGRPVLIFFHDSPMNETSRQIVKHFGKPASVTAFNRYKYIQVQVGTDVSSKEARDYGVDVFPTLVIVDVSGKAIRQPGFIAEADFTGQFLPLGKGVSGVESPTTGPHP
ncbi:MAG: hypothetical protein NTV86_15755 [Planctomycetota bacterium]|nr:hypothetical protein [Planctomycetota bacterium]